MQLSDKTTNFAAFYNIMTDEEFDQMWERAKARDEREEAEWNALPPEEKERRRKMYDDGFYERISDDPTGWSEETSESDDED